MAPYAGTTTITTINEEVQPEKTDKKNTTTPEEIKGYKSIFGEYKTELIWLNIISITIFHLWNFVMICLFPLEGRWKTVVWGFFMGGVSGFGVTAGAHRYWCHRSYKAKMPLQIILMICYSVAGQNTIFDWVRDHRVHHRFSETEADPHDSNRGFFFAHMGWLWMKKHPEVIRRGREVDMSDILNDPVVQFHNKYFLECKMLFCFLIPTAIPVYLWGEDWLWAFTSQCLVRYMLSLHFTWSVNSAAHLYGFKPYDTKINPRENLLISFLAMGEGWHNYHHTFPWDYKASELGKLNCTLMWLNFFGKIGWAYDMKSPSKELVQMVIERRGDKSFLPGDYKSHHHHAEVPEDFEEQLLKASS